MRKQAFIATIILAALCMAWATGLSASKEKRSGDYVYTVENGKATIIQHIGHVKTIQIPSKLGGVPVVAIGDKAFYQNQRLETLDIPQGVVSIGENAFSQCPLKTATLPASVTTISGSAFAGTELNHIIIDEKNEVFALIDGVMYDKMEKKLHTYSGGGRTNGESFTVPEGILKIGDYAFYGTYLDTVILPETIVEIGASSFANMSSIRSIRLPNSLESFAATAFCGDGYNYYSSSIESFDVSDTHPRLQVIDGVLYSSSGETLLQYPCRKPGETFEIPTGVTHVGDYAFANAKELRKLIIPDSVTEIGDFAFGYSELEVVELPSNLAVFSDGLFYYCSRFQSIMVPDTVTEIGQRAFYGYGGCEGPRNWGGRYDITIPNFVQIIGNEAFAKSRIKNVILPKGLTAIPDGMFFDSTLESIQLPETLIDIGKQAFASCDYLTSIEIPNSVQFIGEDAFADCEKLTVYVTGDGYVKDYLKRNGIPFQNKPDWL